MMNGEVHNSPCCGAQRRVLCTTRGGTVIIIFRICQCGKFNDRSYVKSVKYFEDISVGDGVEIHGNNCNSIVQNQFNGYTIFIQCSCAGHNRVR